MKFIPENPPKQDKIRALDMMPGQIGRTDVGYYILKISNGYIYLGQELINGHVYNHKTGDNPLVEVMPRGFRFTFETEI